MQVILVHAIKLTPEGRQLLTVTAPGSEKFDEPSFVTDHLCVLIGKIQNQVTECAVIKLRWLPIRLRYILLDNCLSGICTDAVAEES